MKHHQYKLRALLFTLLAFIFVSPASAVDSLFDDLGLGGQDDILEVDDAFQLSTGIEGNRFVARWVIAEGHYLYQDKMNIIPSNANIDTHPLQLLPGDEKQDPIFNKLLYVYHDSAEVSLPIANTNGANESVFKVKYQGCSEVSGICYPPQTREISVRLPEIVGAAAAGQEQEASAGPVDRSGRMERWPACRFGAWAPPGPKLAGYSPDANKTGRRSARPTA